MDKEFKEIAQKSQEVLKEATDKAEDFVKDFSEDARSLWGELKDKMVDVQKSLENVISKTETKTDEAVVDVELGMMEAKDKVSKIEKSLDAFVQKHKSSNAETIDIAKLRAHLAKMDIEDSWEETSKKIRHELAEKKVETKLLAKEAADEVRQLSDKIKNLFS